MNKKQYIPPTIGIIELTGETILLQFSGSRNGYGGDEEGGFFEVESVNNEILFPIP